MSGLSCFASVCTWAGGRSTLPLGVKLVESHDHQSRALRGVLAGGRSFVAQPLSGVSRFVRASAPPGRPGVS